MISSLCKAEFRNSIFRASSFISNLAQPYNHFFLRCKNVSQIDTPVYPSNALRLWHSCHWVRGKLIQYRILVVHLHKDGVNRMSPAITADGKANMDSVFASRCTWCEYQMPPRLEFIWQTWDDSNPSSTEKAATEALKVGFRHVSNPSYFICSTLSITYTLLGWFGDHVSQWERLWPRNPELGTWSVWHLSDHKNSTWINGLRESHASYIF